VTNGAANVRLVNIAGLIRSRKSEALDVPARGTLWRSPDGGLQVKVREPFGTVMRGFFGIRVYVGSDINIYPEQTPR
jgi:hypothetical protein